LISVARATQPNYDIGGRPLPGWARIDAPVTDSDEAAFRAGAALAMLDCRVRAGVPFAAAWR